MDLKTGKLIFNRPAALALSILILISTLALGGCFPKSDLPQTPASTGLSRVPASRAGQIKDGGDVESLKRAVSMSLKYIHRLPPTRSFAFGRERVSASGMARSMERVLELLDLYGLQPEFMAALKNEFQFFAMPVQTLYTGYYEPIMEGSRRPEGRFTSPLYAKPADLVHINLADFGLEKKKLTGQVKGGRVKPYPTRGQIDSGAIKGRAEVLAWVDPIESFFLHIQGSGRIAFPDGENMRVGYATQNGRRYVALGRVLINRGLMSKDVVSLQSLKAYLREHPAERDELLATNPSYIFFRTTKDGPLGCLGVPVTAMRSIAVDRKLFPDGALALVQTDMPRLAEGRIKGKEPLQRLVLLQDTGGAIKGPGRADFFFGSGSEAALRAGSMKRKGKLFVMVLRSALEN